MPNKSKKNAEALLKILTTGDERKGVTGSGAHAALANALTRALKPERRLYAVDPESKRPIDRFEALLTEFIAQALETSND